MIYKKKLQHIMRGTILLFLLTPFILLNGQSKLSHEEVKKSIQVEFKGDSKIEVGNFYSGLEFHHSSPIPQRISFYYPVANSIDLSNDYWTRDSTFVMALGLEVDGKKEWIGHEIYNYSLTPYSVVFSKTDNEKSIVISYEFCKDKPAFVINIEIKNTSSQKKNYRLVSNLETSLKTSHTYNLKDNAWTEYDSKYNAIYTNYDDKEVQNASVFAFNAGDKPKLFGSESKIKKLPVENNEWWNNSFWEMNNKVISKDGKTIPASEFLYEKQLQPGESMNITQVIGSGKQDEAKGMVKYLAKNFKEEITKYENYVLDYASSNNVLTGDSILDKSILWAKAVLAVNQHYIDGSIQPMPCPAEYNFYFTHDVLLTGLAAVSFDLERVKNNLQFIISHGDKNNIIPHAYYWKDSSFVTELATPDNWNHFWFVILSGSYLRHSDDKNFLKKLYPYITKSLTETLTNRKNNLMYAFRPDWWDIGRNYGPRSFMTILAIKSLREYVFISEKLSIKSKEIKEYELMANEMQAELNKTLWIEDKNYLMNYFEDGSLDEHYYIGSLLAAHFNLLDSTRTAKLVETAAEHLLDPKIGIYAANPMDFANLVSYLRLVGNEAGDAHKYINGGVWQHGNAWYALALIKAGKKKEALEFIKTVMTVDGVINSPNGQPAMYEYRNSDNENPKVYGEIDKPQFMWAAGWYLYCINELYGNK